MYFNQTEQFKKQGYTFIRTPLLQPFDTLREQITDTYHPQMVKMINLKGQIDVLRFDNTLSALQIAADKGLSKIFTHEPVYVNDFEKGCVKELWGISAESLAPPSAERDSVLLQLLLLTLESLHGKSFILEWSHTGWFERLMAAEPVLAPVKESIAGALKKRNMPQLTALIHPYEKELRCEKDLIYLLSAHGSYQEQREKMRNTAYEVELTDLLQTFDRQYMATPEWAKDLIYLDLAFQPKLSHYEGLYFQSFSLSSNTLLAAGGAYRYVDPDYTGIGFIIYTEEESYE